jgi:hypothetical protein
MIRSWYRKLALVGLATICTSAAAQINTVADAVHALAEHGKLDTALGKLAPQRPGTVDAYVIVVALDDDPVFGREAREAGRVLARRFGASDRTLVLAADEGEDKAHAAGSPPHLATALRHVAGLMDRDEDVLVLYSTSHGVPGSGLLYKELGTIRGTIAPYRFAAVLNSLEVRNRLIILQACYSGQFIPPLENDTTVVITAAAADRSSFGCAPGNDWTFFGHAFVNRALRRPAPLRKQFEQAETSVGKWEANLGLLPSRPQISVGAGTEVWLKKLEARAGRGITKPVGQPPVKLED